MPYDQLAKVLVDAGGWVTAVALIAVILGLVIKGELVSGKTYRREAQRVDRLTDLMEKLSNANETLATQVHMIADLVSSILRPRV